MLVHKEVLRNIHKYLIKTKKSTVFSPITSMQHPMITSIREFTPLINTN